MRRFLLPLDTIDILSLVYSNVFVIEIIIMIAYGLIKIFLLAQKFDTLSIVPEGK